MNGFHRFLARLLMVAIAGSAIPLPAHAGMVATETLATASATSAQRAQLAALLARDDLRMQLEAKGVRAADVQARIDALSDEEVAQLTGRIDALPAGGDIVGAIVFVFLVLLVTDLLGLTKVFSFTKPIKK